MPPGTMPPIPDESSPVSYHNLSSPPDHYGTRNPPSIAAHSRESSVARGRAQDPSVLPSSSLQPQNPRRANSHSKSPDPLTGRQGAGYDTELERRPSNSYGHHRQTSIVHGIQHSRNPSLAASSSPLSPAMIASIGRSGSSDSENTGTGRPEQSEMHSTYQNHGTSTPNQPAQGQLGTVDDQIASGVSNSISANPLHRRMNSTGRQWRDRSHGRSQSKHYSESKTVGEYALHHLFNSVRTTLNQPIGRI